MQSQDALQYDDMWGVNGEGVCLALMLLEGIDGDVSPFAALKRQSASSPS
jgi:hypothetical protein